MDLYLEGLIGELRRAMTPEGRQSRITLSAEPIRVETDKAVSIGLIVNELVTNALKYAYPECEGDIRVRFARNADAVQLVVEDDGVGYQEGAPPKGSGLGATIVSAMARTVKATIKVNSGNTGTQVVLSLAN